MGTTFRQKLTDNPVTPADGVILPCNDTENVDGAFTLGTVKSYIGDDTLSRLGEEGASETPSTESLVANNNKLVSVQEIADVTLAQLGDEGTGTIATTDKIVTDENKTITVQDVADTTLGQLGEEGSGTIATTTNLITDENKEVTVQDVADTTLLQLGDSGSASSVSDSTKFITDENKEVTGRQIADYVKSIDDETHNIYIGADTTSTDEGYYELLTFSFAKWDSVALTLFVSSANYNDNNFSPAIAQLAIKFKASGTKAPYCYLLGGVKNSLNVGRLYLAYSTTDNIAPKLYIKELSGTYDPLKINILDFTDRNKQAFKNRVTINESPTLITDIPSDYDTVVCLADLIA